MNYTITENDRILFQYTRAVRNKRSPIVLHYHDRYEFFMLLSGRCDYAVEGNMYTLQPYDLVFTNDCEIHQPIYDDTVKNERICMNFVPQYTPFFLSNGYNPLSLLQQRKLGTGNVLPHTLVREIGVPEDLQSMEQWFEKDTPSAHLRVQLLFATLLVKIADALSVSGAVYQTNPLVSDVVQYIAEHLTADLRHETLGSIFFVSPNHLQRIFKAQTGYTLSDYIRLKRIIKARELLIEGYSTTDAATATGFHEYTTFYRAFKTVIGVHPSTFSAKI